MSEFNSFFIDTERKTDETKVIPIFSGFDKFEISPEDEEACQDLLQGMSIKEALEKCPIKVKFFKESSDEKEEKTGKFKDKLLNSLDSYLEEIRPKEYEFITDGIETKKDISKLGMSDRQLKKFNRKERDKTKGSKWFDMKAPEMTEELKNDLKILQMRSALDPKHFYKRSEMKALPKYFEIGRVVDAPVEYHESKNIRKRNKTLVDELMEDAEFQKFNKKKYKESVEEKQKQANHKKFNKKANKNMK